MRPDVQHDFDWGRGFLPELKMIVGLNLIGEAPHEEDAERNTDLIVLKLDAVRIACRIRRHKYLDGYGHQFTLRSGRPTGAKTELAKVVEGWGDYLLYGFADEHDHRLAAWALCDLRVFRGWYFREVFAGRKPGESRTNGDGTAFIAFSYGDLPDDFTVARVRQQVAA